MRAVGRDRARLQPLVDRGAEPWVGDIGDRAFVERAVAGADAALLVVRADLRSPSFGADFHRVGRAYAVEDRLGRRFPSERTTREDDVAAMVAGGASLDFATRMNDTWEIFSARGVRGAPEVTVLSTRPIEDFIAAELIPAIERGPAGGALPSARAPTADGRLRTCGPALADFGQGFGEVSFR